jgi:hypothetical protein
MEVLFNQPAARMASAVDVDVFEAESRDLIDEHERKFQNYSSQESPKFAVGDRVLVRMDDRKRIKTKYPWEPAVVVQPLGFGAYIVRDNNGREARFNEKSLARAIVNVPVEDVPNEPVERPVIETSEEVFLDALESPGIGNNTGGPQSEITIPTVPSPPPQRRSARNRNPPRRLVQEM